MAVVYAVLMGFAVLELTMGGRPVDRFTIKASCRLPVYHIDNMMLFIYHLEFRNKM